jgi:fimbrial isopeptide formation D2 family protein/LPXTG-motif cell wall-anchored protein
VAGATATDNLSDVLDNAAIDSASLAAGLSLVGTTMTWAIPTLAPGQSVTVSYAVTVSADQWDATLRNVVTPNGLGGECAVLSDCTTEHFTPAWALTKSSDPVSGSEVEPGDDIVYTLTATNTSDATVEGAKAEDDLAEVLNNATLDEATLDAELSLSGSTLTWAIPTLLPGESASVSYTVTVDTDAFNVILENVVVPVGAGGVCVEDADCTTTHDTPEVLGEEVIRPRPPVVAGVELPSTGAPENAGLFGLLGAVTVGLGALLISADRRRRQT